MRTSERGQQGRPTTADVEQADRERADPQSAKEGRIRRIFTEQKKLLVQLFPKDGETLVARAVSSAIMASRTVHDSGSKAGQRVLEYASAEAIAEKVIAAHHMGLEPGTECYLVPYGGKIQLQIGPQGLVKLMMQSGFVRKVEARSVRGANELGGDVFDYDLGDEGFIRHRKGDMRSEMPVTHGYAFVETTTGGKVRDVLTRGEIEHFRSLSKMPNGGPMWENHYDGAVRKTCLHRIAEFIPRSPLLSAALRQNETGGVEVPEEILAAVQARLTSEIAPVADVSSEPMPLGNGASDGISGAP